MNKTLSSIKAEVADAVNSAVQEVIASMADAWVKDIERARDSLAQDVRRRLCPGNAGQG
jgi:hypothetical protein